VADLNITGPVSAAEPTLAAHVATKNYVDTTRNQSLMNMRTANYTLSLSDDGKTVDMNSTSATTVTVPTNATVAFPIGTVIRIRRLGTGTVSVVGASGVGIAWASSFSIPTRYTVAEIHKGAADTWVGMLIGS
jgi:hypothetical protein